jgi:amino acid permease
LFCVIHALGELAVMFPIAGTSLSPFSLSPISLFPLSYLPVTCSCLPVV